MPGLRIYRSKTAETGMQPKMLILLGLKLYPADSSLRSDMQEEGIELTVPLGAGLEDGSNGLAEVLGRLALKVQVDNTSLAEVSTGGSF